MPSNCFIQGCSTGRKTAMMEVHMFRPPTNPERFTKWKQACYRKDRELKLTSTICHRHFSDDQIRKEATVRLPDGTVLSTPLLNWRLQPHAIPSQSYVSPLIDPTRNPDVHTFAMPSSDSCLGDNKSGHEPMETHNESEPDVNEMITEEVRQDAEDCAHITETNIKQVEETTGGHVMIPNMSNLVLQPLPLTSSTEIGQTHQMTSDGAAQITDILKEVEQQRTRWKNKAKSYMTLYKRWKSRYYRLNKKKDQAKEKDIRDGVFIPYGNLNQREIMYANALARKANVKNTKGMRYADIHMLEALNTACKGRNTYDFIRNNSIQVMPSLQTIRRLKWGVSNTKKGLDTEGLL